MVDFVKHVATLVQPPSGGNVGLICGPYVKFWLAMAESKVFLDRNETKKGSTPIYTHKY